MIRRVERKDCARGRASGLARILPPPPVKFLSLRALRSLFAEPQPPEVGNDTQRTRRHSVHENVAKQNGNNSKSGHGSGTGLNGPVISISLSLSIQEFGRPTVKARGGGECASKGTVERPKCSRGVDGWPAINLHCCLCALWANVQNVFFVTQDDVRWFVHEKPSEVPAPRSALPACCSFQRFSALRRL